MAASVSSDQAREALRREHGVRLVSPNEEGAAAEDVGPGVYGFTSSPVLASPMFAVRRYRNFEIHHLAGGSAVVGFVSPADAAKLTHNTGEPVTIRLFPDADDEATTIVSIPYARVVQHRQYSVRNAEAITLQVASSPERSYTA
jgi:hypothetical protein